MSLVSQYVDRLSVVSQYADSLSVVSKSVRGQSKCR